MKKLIPRKLKGVYYLTDHDLCCRNVDSNIKMLQDVFNITEEEKERGRAYSIYSGDPDYIKTTLNNSRGNITFVKYEINDSIYIISNMELDIEDKEIIEWWLGGAKNDKIGPDNNNWNYWFNNVISGIAYRGGSGYIYGLYAKEIV